ncbi:Glycoside hydrolase family 61 protein [Mycena indigotica]|uniref:AA9 family lytic polysaccharide monooxygenase n=1 Tax=Mycena indigotica TaxID=2126181 RepID=A0A8H6VYX4_9AGAR|nr:Glycoside hydrolase family 61 protein [Mycena indigotica]KAF7298907.1 Glycoside hydrolase family 61 protein [Mycena indigotica]
MGRFVGRQLSTMKALFALIAAALPLVSASGSVFSAVSVNGVDQGHAVGVRVPTANTAVTNVNSADLTCNKNFIQPVSQAVISVPAGSQVTAQFHKTAAGYLGPDPSEPLDPTNKGPVVAWLASVPSATQTNVSGLKWFKIWQSGLNSETGQWASDALYVNKGNVTFPVPSCLPNGDYLLRVEYIGLEYATSYPGAQFFMSCAQIHISGSDGTNASPSTVSIPGAYAPSDMVLDSLVGIDSYTIPGPDVFTC